MSRGGRLRTRAVRSTPEALEALESGLQEKWRREFPSRRLTRALRAELLGVSEGTVPKIFQNSGVDRPTLIHAFSQLGLDWQENFILVEDQEEAIEVEEPPEAIEPVPSQSPRRVFALASLAAIFALVAIWLYITRPGAPSTTEWVRDFNPLLERGTKEYRDGAYDAAERDLTAAVELARSRVAPTYLSCALHVLGDLQSARGRLEEAETTLTRARGIREAFEEDRFMPAILCSLGEVQHRIGNLRASRESFERANSGYQNFADRPGMAMALRGLGTVARKERKFDEAFGHFASALKSLEGLRDQDPMVDDIIARRALVYRDLGDFARARKDVEACLANWRQRGHRRWVAETEFQLATIEGLAGNSQNAVKLLTSCNEAFRQVGDRANEADSAKWLERYRLSRR